MRTKLLSVLSGMALLALASGAQAGFVLTPNTFVVPIGNDFETPLVALGFGGLDAGGGLSVDMDGTISFFFNGKEAGFNNGFKSTDAGINVVYTDNFIPWADPGAPLGSYPVSSGMLLDWEFTSNSGTNAVIGDSGFGIFVDEEGDLTSSYVVYLGYGDRGGSVDGDYDDLIVSATFTPASVPEPASLVLMAMGLLGIGAFARRSKG